MAEEIVYFQFAVVVEYWKVVNFV